MYLRAIFVCALLAMIGCASAQDIATCRDEGRREGPKAAGGACTAALNACKDGKKRSSFTSTKGFDKACTTAAFEACKLGVYPCPYAPRGGEVQGTGCAGTDFEGLYDEEMNNCCSDFALRLYPSPRTSGTSAVTRPAVPAAEKAAPAAEVTPTATDNAGGAAGPASEAAGEHDGDHPTEEGTAGDAEHAENPAGGRRKK